MCKNSVSNHLCGPVTIHLFGNLTKPQGLFRITYHRVASLLAEWQKKSEHLKHCHRAGHSRALMESAVSGKRPLLREVAYACLNTRLLRTAQVLHLSMVWYG